MIQNYLDEMEANGKAQNTIRTTKTILTNIDNFKSLELMTKNDLMAFFKQLKTTESVFQSYQGKIKKYYTDAGKPEMVSWIKLIKPKETLSSNDILTTDDINKLIESTDNLYMKALMAFLYESGCRIGESSILKYKDFIEDSRGLLVNIPTMKTGAGYRQIVLIYSAGYIRNLKAMACQDENDLIFGMARAYVSRVIRKIAVKAGIQKAVNPHSFRHASATAMVQNDFNESIIKKKLGWSGSSAMINRYIHLNDDDVINATLSKAGITEVKRNVSSIKTAEPLKLADASMQLSRLSEENQELKSRLERLESLISSTGKPGGLLTMDSITFEKGGREITMSGTVNKDMSEKEALELKEDMKQIVKNATKSHQDEPGRKIIGK